MPTYVVSEADVESFDEQGDTASIRPTLGKETGSPVLEQRVIRFAPGRSRPRSLGDRQEVLYVVAGNGTLHLDGRPHELEPRTGAYVAACERYEIENPGPSELLVVSATAPQSGDARPQGERRTVRYDDQPSLPASGGRTFRYLVTAEVGCRDLTQFLGEIAPGRAPDHSHVYDEVIYVLEGEGVLHADGRHSPVGAGSSIHLPPFLVHSLENTGSYPMRIVAVFHPAGDPASRAYEAND